MLCYVAATITQPSVYSKLPIIDLEMGLPLLEVDVVASAPMVVEETSFTSTNIQGIMGAFTPTTYPMKDR